MGISKVESRKGKIVETAWQQGTTPAPGNHAGLLSHQTQPAEPFILAPFLASDFPLHLSPIDSHKRPGLSIRTSPRTLQFSSLIVLILLAILSGSAAASPTRAHGDRHHKSLIPARNAQFGQLLVDRSTEPVHHFLPVILPRDTNEPATSSRPTTTSTPTGSPKPSSTGDAPGSGLTAVPMPFDTSLGNNFTAQSCPDFFVNFLNNATFQACSPLSLLLYNSVSFFDATKTTLAITQTLDATCNVNYEQCSKLMGYLSQEIPKDNVCGADLKLGNPSVTQALSGFIAYQPLYAAGCMKDDEGNYCFSNAITNDTSPDDSYIYYLPLGTNLPGGSRPTCNSCLKDTMAIFDVAAANSSQPLSKTYVEAAGQINLGCGPSFVNATIAQVSSAPSGIIGRLPLFTLAITLLAIFI